MKRFLLFIYILSASLHAQSKIPLNDTFKVQDYFLKSPPPELSGEDKKLEKIHPHLKRDITKKRASFLLKQLSPLIPSIYLHPLLYWRLVENNKSKQEELLSFIMTNRLLHIRDLLIYNSEREDEILTEVQSLFQLSTRNSYHSLFSENIVDIQQKAKIMSAISDDIIFVRAIKETDLLKNRKAFFSKFQHYFRSSPLGPIPGNHVEYYEDSPHVPQQIIQYMKMWSQQQQEFDQILNHEAFKHSSVLSQLKAAVSIANKSLFIRLEEIDGSIGLSFIQNLLKVSLEKLKTNPDFKVLLIWDILSSPKIKNYLIQNLNQNATLKKAFLVISSKENTESYRHIIVDGKSEDPIAFITTKKLSDLKGTTTYDHLIKIEGPAAAFIQYQSLLTIQNSKEDFIEKAFIPGPVDFNKKGEDLLVIAHAHSNKNYSNFKDVLFEQIQKSKKSLFIEAAFLYDTQIVDAIIRQKKEHPSLDIKILLDHNESLGKDGFPNMIFAHSLINNGVEIRTRKSSSYSSENSELNNRSSLSFDSQSVFLGPLTLSPTEHKSGINVLVYSSSFSKKRNASFRHDWMDLKETARIDIENHQLQKSHNQVKKENSALFRAFIARLLALDFNE